jgi:two-component system cell cycle sensor histidine kinase/response regulator CckA
LKRDRVTVPAGDYIVVRVSDEGIGIDDEALQKIFEPF